MQFSRNPFKLNIQHLHFQLSNGVANDAKKDEDDECEIVVYSEVESSIDWLLNSLADSAGIVRYAAAKALGRLASRLTQQLGGKVGETVN